MYDFIRIENEEITIIDNGKRFGILTNDPRFKDESFMIDVISSIEIIN